MIQVVNVNTAFYEGILSKTSCALKWEINRAREMLINGKRLASTIEFSRNSLTFVVALNIFGDFLNSPLLACSDISSDFIGW